MSIKKIFPGLVVASIIFAACGKNSNSCSYSNSTVTAPVAEIQALQDSLDSNHITATPDVTGFFYTIDTLGSGAAVTSLCSTISVSYKGTFFNDSTFDSTVANQVATFQAGQVILGWQKGIPLISKGGWITLYLPPTLAYGPNPVTDNYGNVIIPGNSCLVYKIHLVDIQ